MYWCILVLVSLSVLGQIGVGLWTNSTDMDNSAAEVGGLYVYCIPLALGIFSNVVQTTL